MLILIVNHLTGGPRYLNRHIMTINVANFTLMNMSATEFDGSTRQQISFESCRQSSTEEQRRGS